MRLTGETHVVVFAGVHVQYAGPGGRVRVVVAPVVSQPVTQTVVLPVLPLVEVPHVVHRVHEQRKHHSNSQFTLHSRPLLGYVFVHNPTLISTLHLSVISR